MRLFENFLFLSRSSNFMSVRFRIFYGKKSLRYFFFPILINSSPGSGLLFEKSDVSDIPISYFHRFFISWLDVEKTIPGRKIRC